MSLPSEWKTIVTSGPKKDDSCDTVVRVALDSAEDFKMWLQAYQNLSKCTYRVRRTYPQDGKHVNFKVNIFLETDLI